ncbi:trissin receptor isoform X1 [Aedes aegypti]|uniref:G-protein coupled receptors family 1 profile domain-containing protein n=1 Tax=Aedes aegypti TaxID=7159 RepID=A0A6I8T9Z9_AEDAE|nr:trissin receptor isoform X1 [Aedes aegypti]XP_021702488.1 trissin receptor isoform X1 [Aedes aegypti]
MSSLGFIDYANFSSFGMMGLLNASLNYLNGSNGSAPGLVGGQLVGSAAIATNFGPFGANNTSSLSSNFSTGATMLLNNSPASLPNGSIVEFGLVSGAASAATVGQSFATANFSYPESGSVHKEFIFDRTDVRVIFITLYSLVFCCCFFGNLLVILVVTLSRRLRSITNFFLANLAVADLCVGVFCVMQNLTIYLIESWVFGDFLCKMYQFVHSLSYTASIFILVVICMERYFAIIHPITCKQILTSRRLRLVIVAVWITSAVYSVPKFIFVRTITNNLGDDQLETICIINRKAFNSELFDIINFALLYLLPLLVMTVLYSRIAIALWKSSRGLERHIALQNTTSSNYSNNFNRKPSSKYEKRAVGVTESQVSVESDKVVVTTWRSQNSFHQRHGTQLTQVSHSSNNVLRARRGVIRMLMVVVLTFALCNLPFHARKMWQYWSTDYQGDSNFNALFTPLTFLVTYFNSGVNPLLYAFLSRNFRKGMRELLLCSLKKNKNKSLNQRIPMHNHSLPTDSTHVGFSQ